MEIIWSSEENGEAITEPLQLGEGGYSLSNPSAVDVWLRHTGTYPLTNLKLYIGTLSGEYEGNANPQSDFDEIIASNSGGVWGQLQINLNDDDSFPISAWRDLTRLYGGKLETAIELGTLNPEESIHFQLRMRFDSSIPSTTTLGTRQVDLRLTYSSMS